MSFTINSVNLIGGNLTKDSELKYVRDNTARLVFSVAMNHSYKKQGASEYTEEVSYFRVIYWGNAAAGIAEFLKKGTKVAIEGRLNQNRWEDESGKKNSIVEIVARKVLLMGGRQQSNNTPPESTEPPEQYDDTEEIPF